MERKFCVALGILNADSESIKDKDTLKHIKFIGSLDGVKFNTVFLRDKLISIPVIKNIKSELIDEDTVDNVQGLVNYKAVIKNFYKLYIKIPKQNNQLNINSIVIIEEKNNSYEYYSLFLFKPEDLSNNSLDLAINLHNTGEVNYK